MQIKRKNKRSNKSSSNNETNVIDLRIENKKIIISDNKLNNNLPS